VIHLFAVWFVYRVSPTLRRSDQLARLDRLCAGGSRYTADNRLSSLGAADRSRVQGARVCLQDALHPVWQVLFGFGLLVPLAIAGGAAEAGLSGLSAMRRCVFW
jgi:hypothetical protein